MPLSTGRIILMQSPFHLVVIFAPIAESGLSACVIFSNFTLINYSFYKLCSNKTIFII